MRTRGLAAAALALTALVGCGSEMDSMGDPDAPATPSAPPSLTAPSPSASKKPVSPKPASPKPASPKPASKAQVASVADDVAEYAVAMEQFFFSNGYPKDLAGALATAKQLTNLKLSPGNKIASYRFDPDAQEFQLCVENPSGASATYDTDPMSTIETTDTGGCPR